MSDVIDEILKQGEVPAIVDYGKVRDELSVALNLDKRLLDVVAQGGEVDASMVEQLQRQDLVGDDVEPEKGTEAWFRWKARRDASTRLARRPKPSKESLPDDAYDRLSGMVKVGNLSDWSKQGAINQLNAIHRSMNGELTEDDLERLRKAEEKRDRKRSR